MPFVYVLAEVFSPSSSHTAVLSHPRYILNTEVIYSNVWSKPFITKIAADTLLPIFISEVEFSYSLSSALP
jgi:hypothetical protein